MGRAILKQPGDSLLPIHLRYALFVDHPFYIDEFGAMWLERLWHRDFVAHLNYLQDLILVAPRRSCPHAGVVDLCKLDVPLNSKLRVVEIPSSARRRLSIFRSVISGADVVQPATVGWHLGWAASVIALLLRKHLVLIVESSPWRVAKTAALRRRVKAAVEEWIIRWLVNHASISFFTHPQYKRSLLTAPFGVGIVTPASWINDADIIDRSSAAEAWSRKGDHVRVLFVGSLVSAKGLEVLLKAVVLLQRQPHLQMDIDIIGEGPLKSLVETAVLSSDFIRVHLLSPISYGAAFFELVRKYHLVVVPSLGDEQPRILFDAYSQSVPVLASSTEGIRNHVLLGETGWLIPPGDAERLAEALANACPAALELAGLKALEHVRGMTHKAMHLERWRSLASHLNL
jgi:glycosyltransferase involved in cell wall biosynthesis